MGDDADDRMTIGEFARACGLSAKALRLYDEMGLVVPAEVDAFSGYRRYAPGQLGRARLVARLRLAGLPLARIRVVADQDPGAAVAELTSYGRQVQADARTTQRLIADLVTEFTKEHAMSVATTTPTSHPEPAVRLGRGARVSQEDAVRHGGGLYAVADGVEGIRGVGALVLGALAEPTAGRDPLQLLDEGVTRAAAALTERHGDDPEAASTLTAVIVGPGRVWCAHVGDSRLHLVRAGRLHRLTRDHTLVATLLDEGRLTTEEARTHPERALLNRAVAAGSPYAPDLSVHPTLPGDRLVLTTDGVHAVLDPELLAGLLLAEDSGDAVVDAVQDAVERAGAPDNYAVLLLDLP